jgi:hypothetical protein
MGISIIYYILKAYEYIKYKFNLQRKKMISSVKEEVNPDD